DAAIVVPRGVQPVWRDRVHAHVVVVGDHVAIEGLGLGDVGARIGAPDLADGAHRARALAEERVVALPVHLLVLEADQRDDRVRTLLEGASLPAVDEIRAVGAGLVRLGHLQAAHHPAAARLPLVGVRVHGDAVAREAVGGRSRGAVSDVGATAGGTARRATDRPGAVRPIAR